MFVNRDEELGFLRDSLSQPEPQLLVLYGRRRVGKTRLVNRYLEEEDVFDDSVYYLADERGTDANVNRFAEEAADALGDIKPDADGFDDVFEYISARTDSCLVVIDEFSYLVEKGDSVPSTFQYIWDEIIEDDDSRISLVLLGSSISMMEEGVLSYESPLDGRRTGQWKLTPFGFEHTREFFPDYTFEDRVRAYATVGGVPAYLEKFDAEDGLFENIEKQILTKGSFLYEEPEFLLRQELREPSTYMGMLESMALGSTTVTEVANDIGRDASGLSRYLKNLKELGMVEKVTPVTADASSRGIYEITDNFFRFWFRFVYPRSNSLERGATSECRRSVESGIDEYASRVFEDICREAVYKEGFGFDATDVGRWWYKEEELDVVAVNEETNGLLLGECKWTESPVCEGIARRLEEKADEVRWRDGERSEKFVLFSKSGFEEGLSDELGERWMLYDTSDISTLFA